MTERTPGIGPKRSWRPETALRAGRVNPLAALRQD